MNGPAQISSRTNFFMVLPSYTKTSSSLGSTFVKISGSWLVDQRRAMFECHLLQEEV